jgi:heptosyltransferase-2
LTVNFNADKWLSLKAINKSSGLGIVHAHAFIKIIENFGEPWLNARLICMSSPLFSNARPNSRNGWYLFTQGTTCMKHYNNDLRSISNTDPIQILIVGPAWVGDMVMAQSLFISLKRRYPKSRIDVLAPAWSFPLLHRMPEVNEALLMPLGHGQFGFLERCRIGLFLRNRKYDWAIIIPSTWKSALPPFFAGCKRRTGYVGEQRFGLLNDMRELDRAASARVVDRYVALGWQADAMPPTPSPPPAMLVNPELAEKTRAELALPVQAPLVLCPGAEGGPAKRWPTPHFGSVSQWWLEQGGVVWLMGSEKDYASAAAIDAATGYRCHNLCGKTSLDQAVDLLSLAVAVVSNDSGLMHVAAALKKPQVAIYGSTDPNCTPPLNGSARIVRLVLPCSPCGRGECPLGHYQCLNGLEPKEVIAALGQLLAVAGGAE